MAMSVVYTNFNGRIVKENRGGVERYYAPDTLGSTALLLDSTGAVTDTFTYWPFGEIQNHTGPSTTPFTFVGSLGYYFSAVANWFYVRARFYQQVVGRWLTVDPLWPKESAYCYVGGRPRSITDPSGRQGIFGSGFCDPGFANSLSHGMDEISKDIDCKWCANSYSINARNAGIDFCRRMGITMDQVMSDYCLNDGPGGAIRHCVGSCMMNRHCGAKCAMTVLNDHEAQWMDSAPGSYNYLDTCMDLFNNSVGKNLARYKGTCIDLCTTALSHGSLSMNQGLGFKKANVDCTQWMKR